MNTDKQKLMANALRFLAIDSVEKAQSGHPGLPMGMADVVTVLYANFFKCYAKDGRWLNRDRLILSAGHGSALLYSLLYLLGYPDIDLEDLKKFRQLHSVTAGHPEFGLLSGIETTTGPLGQGFANAVGMAIGEKILSARFKEKNFSYYTYVIASDGDLMEGISHEAASLAGHLALDKLIVFFDDNNITIDGKTDLSVSDDQLKRFESYGWDVIAINGHDYGQINQAIQQAHTTKKPSLIACKTIIGYGSPNKAGSSSCHGSPLGEQETLATRKALNWDYPPFFIPEDILNLWREIGVKNQENYHQWLNHSLNNQAGNDIVAKDDYYNCPNATMDKIHSINFNDLINELQQTKPNLATRQLSQKVLELIVPQIPQMIGGSADLAPSNNTKIGIHKAINKNDFDGNYIHYGIREHAMAAVMNGLSLTGFIPYGGTFLVFSDYLKPALRLSALMQQKVIYVLTHDSIGLGEDGPTHQPIEHLASLRAIPNVLVFRPCDGIEVAESWQIALQTSNKPAVIALTRQNVPTLRLERYNENLTAKGGYIISHGYNEKRDLTLLATGSEVNLAIQAQDLLQSKHNISVTVVSLPCWQLFDQQDPAYKRRILGYAPRIGIEAASSFGWAKYLGEHGDFIGIDVFGASGPANSLFENFSITKEAVEELALKILAQL